MSPKFIIYANLLIKGKLEILQREAIELPPLQNWLISTVDSSYFSYFLKFS